jgi:hypothetical protein
MKNEVFDFTLTVSGEKYWAPDLRWRSFKDSIYFHYDWCAEAIDKYV